MRIKTLLLLVSLFSFFHGFSYEVSANLNSYVELRDVDRGTFNEYRYKITRDVFTLRDEFSVNQSIDENAANRILSNVKTGYRYLPDNLINENNYNNTVTALRKAIKYPDNSVYYRAFMSQVTTFITNPSISVMSGTIDGDPIQGNAPLITTLRGRVVDPNGTNIPDSSYVWWMDVGGKRKVIGTKPSISHTFTQEGNVSVFLDVKSSHKNSKGYSDTLPFSGRINIQVQEKIASVILRVGGEKIPYDNEVKFSPDEARYGIIFDGTSSRPSSGTKFLSTTWDFGNGVRKSYTGSPKVERIVYANEGDYTVTLELKTNQLEIIRKTFAIVIRNPIASIGMSSQEGYLGDTFNFNAVARAQSNLSYQWEVLNLKKDEIILKKAGSLFSYSFPEKGRYSIRLKITDSAGNFDVDTEEVYINSRPPIASFVGLIQKSNQPNVVYFDASKTFDPDFSDDGKLQYAWKIDGQDVKLEKPNKSGSTGYYTFSNTGEFPVVLTVTDPDGITNVSKQTATIKSTLGVDFVSYPRIIQRGDTIRFVADSEKARLYEWNFGDGVRKGGVSSSISHTYNRSGRFNVSLTVQSETNEQNTVIKTVYVGNSKDPVAVIGLNQINGFDIKKSTGVCNGNDAYIINRQNQITFDSNQSIDTNGQNTGLNLSWTIGEDKRTSASSVNHRFDEIGCYPIKLKVLSFNDKTSDTETIWMKVENLKPQISALSIQAVDINADPVVVNVNAIGAQDGDGVIQSYLWYYTTDADSDAQDFRITRTPQTTFVLPKLPGNYHFGVVLKDNNDEKVNSIDILGSNSLTLTGDNINTPLIQFETNDSSASVGKEIIFTAEVTNVLGEDLDKDIEFSWDFDGDGFYDRKTETGKLTYKYKKSGTFYPKVRVRHKGFSNTKTLTVDVANKLVSDFSYISVGNKYIFLDQSRGSISSRKWDLGDGSERKNLSYIVHDYKDKKSVHKVALTVAEGTKTKTNSKTVRKNAKNLLLARKNGLNVFSYPKVNDAGEIILEEEESIFIYLGESKGEISKYGIDFNIDLDSDLNGGKDDDIDNLSEKSYGNGEPQEIPLGESREQTLRVFLIDEDNNTIDSKDLKIIRNYIKVEEAIDPDSLDFGQISAANKERIDAIKDMVTDFPQENRIKGMLYMQKLQDTWNDSREKTITIVEFEEFLSQINDKNSEKITDLLKEIMLDGEKDKGDKTMSYLLLKAYIPEGIDCNTNSELSCREYLTSKLDFIRQSNDEVANKAAGKEILDVIGTTDSLTDEEKLNFKAILKILVYSGVEEIPADEKKDVEDAGNTVEKDNTEDNEDGKLMTFLKKIGWWALGFLILILILMGVFWTLDFLKNRKKGETFTDFVGDKTSPLEEISGEDNSEKKGLDEIDPFNEKSDTKENDTAELNTIPQSTITKKLDLTDNKDTKDPVFEKADAASEKIVTAEENDVPSWLSGSTETKQEDDPIEPTADKSVDEPLQTITPSAQVQDTKIKEEENVPDWLKQAENPTAKQDPDNQEAVTSKTLGTDKQKPAPEEKTHLKTELPLNSSLDSTESINDDVSKVDSSKEEAVDDLDKVTQIEDTSPPGWLQDSLTDQLPAKESEKEPTKDLFTDDISKINSSEKPIVEEKDEDIIIEEEKPAEVDLENNMPDWLKSEEEDKTANMSEKKSITKEAKEIKKEKKEENKKETPKNKQATPKKKKQDKQEPQGEKTNNSRNEPKSNSGKKLKEASKTSPTSTAGGAAIPDWLQGSLDATPDEASSKEVSSTPEDKTKDGEITTTDTNTSEAKSDHLKGTDVPDWLKESLTEDAFVNETKKKEENNQKATSEKNDDLTQKDSKEIKKESGGEDQGNSGKKDKSDDLWDDGMTVPNWLKSDLDK